MARKKSEALRTYNELFRKENEVYHQVADKLGLSDSAFEILYAIYDAGPGCTQEDICIFMGIPKQTVNSSVRKMVQEGILRTEQAGKTVRLYFTDAGEALANRCIVPVQEAEEAAFEQMNEHECAEFLRLQHLYVQSLQTLLEKTFTK